MRVLGRLLLLLLLVVAATFLYKPLRSLFEVPPPAPAVTQQLDLTARPSTVYFLAEHEWLTFPVISQAARLRILTHAGAAPDTGLDAPMRYALEYELVDGKGRVLNEGRYVHETQIPQPLFKDGLPVSRNLYTDRSLAIAAGQSINMQLEGLPRTAFVRLRLEPLAPPLENVAVRLYYEERMSERQASVAWERLSQEKKTRLARGVIYPPELLTREERLNLLERQWQPVGPLGTNPAQGTLFSIQGAESFLDPNLMPRSPGLYAGPNRMGVLPIETAGRYRIKFRPLLVDEDLEPELELRHITERLEEPRQEVVTPTGEPLALEQTLSPGLLVVIPNQPGMLDIWPVGAGKSALPEPRYLRSPAVQPGLPAHFRILPGDDVGTSLRLDLRAHGDGEPLPAEANIRATYRLFDARGRAVDQGSLEARVRPSMIDRVADTQPVADLSEPASFYLRLPPEVTRIELTSHQRLLANAYTRPDDLPHRTRVPVDYYAWRGDDPAQPGWFILQPAAQKEPDTSLVLHLQSRPPERDSELLAGRYQWQALDPQLAARGARILVPLSGEERLRPSGLPGYFKPLRQGAQTVEIAAPGVVRQLEPQLIYLRDNPDPFNLRLRIDGRTVRHELIGRRGEIRLPSISPGRHEMELDASARGIWLMNYRYPEESGYLRRMAFRLEAAPLRYDVDKREDGQLVGARFYSLGEAGAESTVRVRVIPGALESGPSQEWTHLERLYRITPSAGEAKVGYVLDQQRERLSRGQPILVDLGSDLANGSVRVEFSLHSGAPGYLVFHKVLPGQHERTRGFREEEQ
ncbi:hypothetical protein SAMN05216203_0972 [Marinobacter daqiaonensis]|uniref:Uncharacterized protein n=1 Tax=Marinobacter daqiaonensis TaxID=650891 RepID=A0A1I6H7M9_9GAMM|nr:hypothetical protein [Marinobacter daqiaonensis]SFR50503.1 hypothetical protein SAMN05216203_0972 [Marinobacter daqiaonensis]